MGLNKFEQKVKDYEEKTKQDLAGYRKQRDKVFLQLILILLFVKKTYHGKKNINKILSNLVNRVRLISKPINR